mgnify:FL=1
MSTIYLAGDTIVIEPHENVLETMVEVGQIKGYKDCAKELHNLLLEAIKVPSDDMKYVLVEGIQALIKQYDDKVYK